MAFGAASFLANASRGLPEVTPGARCELSRALLQKSAAVNASLTPHARQADMIASCALRAVLHEAAATEKPGLVCADTAGVHTDMDIQTMIASAVSLYPYFRDVADIGRDTAGLEARAVFPLLRGEGREAERAMFAVTCGVNTHKGLIFSMGLFCAAAGRLLAADEKLSAASLCGTASSFVEGIVARDFCRLRELAGKGEAECVERAEQALGRALTAGEWIYLRFGVTGVRGEAERGFPLLPQAVAALRGWLEEGDYNAALVNTLLFLMKNNADTNLLWRGGPEGLALVQKGADRVLEHRGMLTKKGREGLALLRELCLSRRLSPGGSADMLSLALFIHMVEREGAVP
ncbi:MAG: triphosphoribosyl-dephospho-CoA synthase [Desulfovibrio sp.]|jgi:triphosphoribosyl-dephospho-CoA synthetase|nr:triphosphoribosyl-dephospho-CoA synthase [Desulfovibrio sp.]